MNYDLANLPAPKGRTALLVKRSHDYLTAMQQFGKPITHVVVSKDDYRLLHNAAKAQTGQKDLSLFFRGYPLESNE